MKRLLLAVFVAIVLITVIALSAAVYIMTTGYVGRPCTGPVKGKLILFKSTQDEAKFLIELHHPYQVRNKEYLGITIKTSGELVKLKFNETSQTWSREVDGKSYLAGVYDADKNGVVNSWDYLILKVVGGEFNPGDRVILEITGYPGSITSDIVK